MEELNFTMSDVITISTMLLGLAGIYWKVKIDLKSLDLKIAEIQCDRDERWKRHDEDRDKQDAYLDDIMRTVNGLRSDMGELKGDIKSIRTNIEWLKNK
jgi:predicted  nucleic acid-binding Zn-ribbon protein